MINQNRINAIETWSCNLSQDYYVALVPFFLLVFLYLGRVGRKKQKTGLFWLLHSFHCKWDKAACCATGSFLASKAIIWSHQAESPNLWPTQLSLWDDQCSLLNSTVLVCVPCQLGFLGLTSLLPRKSLGNKHLAVTKAAV